MTEALVANQSFSRKLPSLQLAWDSTSLGLLKTCARKYQLSMAMFEEGQIFGYSTRAESVHLTFGILYHGALEHFDHEKCRGQSYDEALKSAVLWTAKMTWNSELKRPWISDNANKNRFTLIRSIVWYCEQFRDDPAKTIVLANGKPAVELSFKMGTQISASTGEEFVVCGHLDRLAGLNNQTLIFDRKTTQSTISQEYFKKFTPHNQFSLYSFAGKVVYGVALSGLIVDAAQIAVTFSRFERGFVPRGDDQLEEWWKDTVYHISQADRFAQINYWPMNDESCDKYGGCPFRDICSRSPKVRNQWLSATMIRRVWDPLKNRGDI